MPRMSRTAPTHSAPIIPGFHIRSSRFVSLALACFAAGCAERGDDTLVFPNGSAASDASAEPAPAPAVQPTTTIPTTTIPASIQSEIREHVTLYEGGSPPNIEGCYLISPEQLSYSNIASDNIGWSPSPTTLCFQRKLGNYLYSYREVEGTKRDSSDSVHVIGSGNTFTAYLTTTGISSDIATKMAVVIAGIKTDAGIRSISYTFTMLSKGADPNERLVKVGAIRSFIDGDGLAATTAAIAGRAAAPRSGDALGTPTSVDR